MKKNAKKPALPATRSGARDLAGQVVQAVAVEDVRIYNIRGMAIMLDSDLADMYGVETKYMNRSVNQHPERFAEPFSFRLTETEWKYLRSQFATSNAGRGGRRHIPIVFTEHGAVMLAAVLKSPRAIAASRLIVDAFIRLRRVIDVHQALARRIDELTVEMAKTQKETAKNKKAIATVFKALRLLVEPAPEPGPQRRIGFRTNEEREREAKGRRRNKANL